MHVIVWLYPFLIESRPSTYLLKIRSRRGGERASTVRIPFQGKFPLSDIVEVLYFNEGEA